MIPSESGKISVITIASTSFDMSFSVSPCESVIRSLIMSLCAERSGIYDYQRE